MKTFSFNRITIDYTIFYLIILFLSNILTLYIPFLFIFREFFIVLLFGLGFFQLYRARFSIIDVFIISFICIAIHAYFVSPNNNEAFSSFIVICSGPMIFLLIRKMNMSISEFYRYKRILNKMFWFFIISSLVIYPFQLWIYIKLGVGSSSSDMMLLYRFKANGQTFMRLSGLCVHPVIMGFVILSMLINCLSEKKHKSSILLVISYYYANARNFLVGIPFGYYSKLSKKKKIYALIFSICVIIIVIVCFPLIEMDSSVVRHFDDLLEVGPKLLKNHLSLFGYGLGTVSPYCSAKKMLFLHVESDYFDFIMQLGVIGFLLYFILLLTITNRFANDKNKYSNICIYLSYAFAIGCLFFPLHPARFLSNYLWIELALYDSVRLKIINKESKTNV